jgi:hypothetical protein
MSEPSTRGMGTCGVAKHDVAVSNRRDARHDPAIAVMFDAIDRGGGPFIIGTIPEPGG